jgi:nitroreductase
MINTIKDRRSIRKFTDTPVTKEHMNILLEAAMLAPSARNARPWEFIVITNREILDNIGEQFTTMHMCKTATAAIVMVAVPELEKAPGMFPQDCGAATQNILLAAQELGLGTCWCGVYPREERMKSITEILSIGSSRIPFCVIAIGHPDEAPEQKGFFEESKVSYIE